MTIKRQYSLPNCRLLLEGIADETVAEGGSTRPLMSMVVHAECSFAGREQRLSGGKEFLENLARAVSAYAQEFLSGVRHPIRLAGDSETVELVRVEGSDRHCLRCYPKADEGGASPPLEIDLTTVQLFDLVEAVDQFFADTRTLPELTLQLAPASRRYRRADEPAVQRSAPLALGVGGLAIAAIALFAMPVPGPIEAPERRYGDTASETADEPTADAPEAGETETESETESEPDEPIASGPPLSAADLAEILADVQQIDDPTELDYIQRYTRRQLETAWDDREAVTQDLTYRVAIGRDGAILDYEPVEGTPEAEDEQTPLPDLQFQLTENAPPEAIAEYKVVFTNGGILQINPWAGYQGTPTLGPEIEDPALLATLGDDLADALAAQWDETPDLLSEQLVYRVGVTEDGTIADYQAQNAAAFELETETPLPDLLEPEAAGIGDETVVPQEPLGQFEVTLYRDGRVEVVPF